MSTLKFPIFTLPNLFKRKAYDPTTFQTINDKWDEITVSDPVNNISANGMYRNQDLLLERINLVKQKLELFDESLPNLKK